MIIHYCEKCGLRIDPAEVKSGAARVTEEGKATCTKCAPARRGSGRASSAAPARESRLGIKPLHRDSKIHIQPSAPAAMKPEETELPPNVPQVGLQNRRILLIGGSVVVVLLVVILALTLGRTRDETRIADHAPGQTSTVPVPPPVVPSNAQPIALPPPVTTPSEVRKEPDGYNPRAALAQSLFEQAKAQFKNAPDDPWTYQENLQALVTAHAQTPAGREAEAILATLNPGPKPADSSLPPEEAWKTARDLLALAHPGGPSGAGTWSLENGALLSTKSGRKKLTLPYSAPDEYDVKLVFARVDGNGNLIINLTHLGQPLSFHVAYGDKSAGWEMLAGKRVGENHTMLHRKDLLDNNRRYTLIIQMRKNRWSAFLDAQFLVGRERDVNNVPISQFKELRLPNPKQIGLISNDGAYRIDEFKVFEVTGKGQVLSETEVAAEREPDDATGAQATDPVEKPVEVARTIDTRSAAYAVWLKIFHLHWANRNWAAAKNCVAEALKNPDLASKNNHLKADQACVALAEQADEAAAQGAALLADGRAFTLEDTKTKKTYETGRKTKVLKADGNTITIQQDIGDGKITLGIPLSDLTVETRFALTRIGLPDDGKGKLALALHRFTDGLKNGTTKLDKTFGELLEQARNAAAPAELLDEIQAWIGLFERERQATEALAGLEQFIAAGKFTESQTALAEFLNGFADTACLTENVQRLPDLEKRIDALQYKPGLWARYYSGDQKGRRQKFHFGRPIFEMDQSFGNSSPEKGIPRDNFSIEMTGVLRITEVGAYTFSYGGDDVLQLFLDGKDHGPNKTITMELTVGEHPIKLIFQEGAGGAFYRFKWKGPIANQEETVPADHLFHRLADTKEEQ